MDACFLYGRGGILTAVVVIAGIVLVGIFASCLVQAGKRADKQMEKLLETEKK